MHYGLGQVLHGGATKTEAARRAIPPSQESLKAVAKRYGINQKTVASSGITPSNMPLPGTTSSTVRPRPRIHGPMGRSRG